MNLDGIGLTAPVKDFIWGDIGAWRAPRRALCHRMTREAVARSLKMNVDGPTCRVAGTGSNVPMLTLSPDAKSMTSVSSAGEWAKNSPSNLGITLHQFH
jgi:hypothetical protein